MEVQTQARRRQSRKSSRDVDLQLLAVESFSVESWPGRTVGTIAFKALADQLSQTLIASGPRLRQRFFGHRDRLLELAGGRVNRRDDVQHRRLPPSGHLYCLVPELNRAIEIALASGS